MKGFEDAPHDREDIMTGKDSTRAIFTADGISRTFRLRPQPRPHPRCDFLGAILGRALPDT